MVVKQLMKPLARPVWNRLIHLTENVWNEIIDQLEQIEVKIDDNSRATLDRISFHGKQLTQLEAQIDLLQQQVDSLYQKIEPSRAPD